MNIKTDSVFRCIKPYSGKNSEGKNFTLNQDAEYCKTQVDMANLHPNRSDIVIYLNEWNTQRMQQLPSLSLDEFSKLENSYLEKVMNLH